MENINNSSVQEPENTVETQKKKLKLNLEKPELFMVFAIAVAKGAVPIVTSLIGAVSSFIIPLFSKMYVLRNIITSAAGSAESILNAVLSIAAVILFAYFAYKSNKIRNAALFIGVFFVSHSVSQVLIERPVSAVLNIIVSVLNSISLEMGWEMYTVVTAATGFVNSSLQFVVDFICLILTAVLAVVLLRIVNGKIKLKKKEEIAEETQATEEVQENA